MKPRSTALAAGGAVAVFVLVLFVFLPVPGALLRAYGARASGVERFGGLHLVWRPPADVDTLHLQTRFAERALGVKLRFEGANVVVDVPGVTEKDVPALAAMIGGGGGELEFREVLDGTIVADIERMGLGKVEVDRWQTESGHVYTDFYLRGPSRAELEDTFTRAQRAGWPLPPHWQIAYERVEASAGALDSRPFWRSYLVADRAALTGDEVANATVSFDPNTNRPVVLLDFDRLGTRIFGDLTSRIVGRKLAIMLGGEIKSAPIINDPIQGGRASITMGGSDPQQQENEARVLAQALRAGALPPGGEIVESRWVPPADTPAAEWLARLTLALGAGLIAAAIAFLSLRYLEPREPAKTLPVTGSASVLGRLAWTGGMIAAFYAIGMYVTLPGINEVEFAHVVAKAGGPEWRAMSMVSVFALGVTPVISAFILVEIGAVALGLFGVKIRRDLPETRRKMAYVVATLAIVITAVQAYFVVRYFEALSRGGVELVYMANARWLIVASLVAGTMMQVWMVSIIATRGIGNGYAILFVASWLFGNRWGALTEAPPAAMMAMLVAVALVVAITVVLLRWRVGDIPLPCAGLAPLADVGGLALAVKQIVALGVTLPVGIMELMHDAESKLVLACFTVVAATVLWSAVFVGPSRPGWPQATAVTAIGLCAIFGITFVIGQYVPVGVLGNPAILMFATATVLDVRDEIRDRGGKLVPVWPLHDPLQIDAVRGQLTAAGIPHHLQSSRLRTLLWFFGPYVPIMVLVPDPHVPAAEKILRELSE